VPAIGQRKARRSRATYHRLWRLCDSFSHKLRIRTCCRPENLWLFRTRPCAISHVGKSAPALWCLIGPLASSNQEGTCAEVDVNASLESVPDNVIAIFGPKSFREFRAWGGLMVDMAYDLDEKLIPHVGSGHFYSLVRLLSCPSFGRLGRGVQHTNVKNHHRQWAQQEPCRETKHLASLTPPQIHRPFGTNDGAHKRDAAYCDHEVHNSPFSLLILFQKITRRERLPAKK
jgi:hypothetical protein